MIMPGGQPGGGALGAWVYSKLKSYKLNCSFLHGLGNNDLCSLVGYFLLVFSSLIKNDIRSQ